MYSKRIETILKVLEKCNTLADIGCDHGYVAVEAIKREVAKKAFAVDINPNPLQKAIELSKKEGVFEKIEFFVGNGFEPIREPVDQAVIAGMGGDTILSILSSAKDKVKNTKLVLQPMKDIELLRRWLFENGFDISEEIIVNDKEKFYIIMKTEKSSELEYSDIDIYVGRHIQGRSKESLEYLLRKKEKLRKIAEMKKENEKDFSEEKKVLQMIEEVLSKW
ncbi:tRNA (adenine(22)-N(1))-methyltransferase [Caldicellulosiruptor naganoensis]|uniref:Class I SAM-dependent methyltransferase n=1 Tax=Caldicellulosiruptor naganoensis TaxID=29324 RepID=A0ABY7BEE8_9FIRM|nr:class I SAM-dependent methyltransferase [Caldicellulosiruptor naganoensis]WAM30793.1 class I SAM-dependent methyltransferase [Caldicellulosiruptor naganoensis]